MSDEKPTAVQPTTKASDDSLRMEYKETLATVRAEHTLLWVAVGIWLAIMWFTVATISSPAVAPALKLVMLIFACLVNGVGAIYVLLLRKALCEIRERMKELTKVQGLGVDILNRMRVLNDCALWAAFVAFCAVFFGLIWLHFTMGTRPAQKGRRECECRKRQHQEYRYDHERGQGKHHNWRMPDREDGGEEDDD